MSSSSSVSSSSEDVPPGAAAQVEEAIGPGASASAGAGAGAGAGARSGAPTHGRNARSTSGGSGAEMQRAATGFFSRMNTRLQTAGQGLRGIQTAASTTSASPATAVGGAGEFVRLPKSSALKLRLYDRHGSAGADGNGDGSALADIVREHASAMRVAGRENLALRKALLARQEVVGLGQDAREHVRGVTRVLEELMPVLEVLQVCSQAEVDGYRSSLRVLEERMRTTTAARTAAELSFVMSQFQPGWQARAASSSPMPDETDAAHGPLESDSEQERRAVCAAVVESAIVRVSGTSGTDSGTATTAGDAPEGGSRGELPPSLLMAELLEAAASARERLAISEARVSETRAQLMDAAEEGADLRRKMVLMMRPAADAASANAGGEAHAQRQPGNAGGASVDAEGLPRTEQSTEVAGDGEDDEVRAHVWALERAALLDEYKRAVASAAAAERLTAEKCLEHAEHLARLRAVAAATEGEPPGAGSSKRAQSDAGDPTRDGEGEGRRGGRSADHPHAATAGAGGSNATVVRAGATASKEKLQSINEDLGKALMRMEQDANRARSALEKAREENTSLRKSVHKLQVEADARHASVASSSQFQQMQHRASMLESELGSSRAELSALLDSYAKLRAVAGDTELKSANVVALQARLAESDEARGRAEEGMVTMAGRVTTLEAEVRRLKKEGEGHILQIQDLQRRRRGGGEGVETADAQDQSSNGNGHAHAGVGPQSRTVDSNVGAIASKPPLSNSENAFRERMMQREQELLAKLASVEFQMQQSRERSEGVDADRAAIREKLRVLEAEVRRRDDTISSISDSSSREARRLRDRITIKDREIEKYKALAQRAADDANASPSNERGVSGGRSSRVRGAEVEGPSVDGRVDSYKRHQKMDATDQTYLKNIIIQFLALEFTQPHAARLKARNSLLPVIATLLQMSPAEYQRLSVHAGKGK